jgi:hypothetical protein
VHCDGPGAARRDPRRNPLLAGWQVRRQRQVLRRDSVLVIPRRERLAVTALVLAIPAEREQDQRLRAAIDELAPQRGSHAHELALRERRLLALDQQGELALEDQVDLLLALVAVDPPSLPGLQDKLVDSESAHAELPAQRHEAFCAVALEARPRGSALHRGHLCTRAAPTAVCVRRVRESSQARTGDDTVAGWVRSGDQRQPLHSGDNVTHTRLSAVALAVLTAGLFMLAGLAQGSDGASAQPAVPSPCAVKSLPSFIAQGEFGTAATVADVVEVSCDPSKVGTGSAVTVTAAGLLNLCHTITWYVPGATVKPTSGPSVQLKVDGEGNANVGLIAGPKCRVGEALISVDEKGSPYETVTTSFKVLPTQNTAQGLYITPASQIEDEISGSVITIAQAEFNKASEHHVRIGADQLFHRCQKGHHIIYVKENRQAIPDKPELLGAIELDNNGNGFVLLIGTDSCAEGPSLIEAELEERPFTAIKPPPTFTIKAPV